MPSVIFMVYLDNAATTQVCPEAAQAALAAMTEGFGNPSSTHGPGRDARQALKAARDTVAASLGARPEEVFFTSGGSEGDNQAIRGACALMRHKGKHIVSGLTEHDAVRKTLDAMQAQGWEVTRLAPGPDGAVSADAVAAALRPDTALVSLMLVNNETGAVTDIPAVSRAIRAAECPALLHTDAIQGYMKVPFSVKSLGADIVTVSGHKIHAPKGVGAQYVRAGVRLPALVLGGGQEAAIAPARRICPASWPWPQRFGPIRQTGTPKSAWPLSGSISSILSPPPSRTWSSSAAARPTSCAFPCPATGARCCSICWTAWAYACPRARPASGAGAATCWRPWACRRR